MPETKSNVQPIFPQDAADFLYKQTQENKSDIRDVRQELCARMNRLEHRQEKLEEKIDKLNEKIDTTRKELDKKINDKFDQLAEKMDASFKHNQIFNVTALGVVLGIIYFLFR